jgi:D-3-phosphoglycerate dehydrogenase
MYKVVLTDYEWPDLNIEKNIFLKIGADFVAAHCVSELDVINLAENADAVITEYAPLTKHVIEKLVSCKIISMNAAGYDNVDVEAATEAGILVVNCPDYCYDEVADHTMALLLACARGIVRFDHHIKKKVWDFKSAGRLNRIRGSILGLVGFGGVARAVGKRAKAFGMKVIAYDPYVSKEIFNREEVVQVTVEAIFEESDFISIHTPRTPETINLVSQKELSIMKKSAYIINTSRGSILDEKALLNALQQEKIGGAAIDVMDREPPDFWNTLFSCDNLIVTPHAAFYSEDAMAEVRRRGAEQVIQVLEGKWPQHIVNKELLVSKKTRANLV